MRSLLRGREETPHPPAPRGRSTSSHASFPAGPTAGLTLPAAPSYHPARPLPGFGPAGLPEEFPARPPPPPRPSRRAVRSLGSEIGAPHGRERPARSSPAGKRPRAAARGPRLLSPATPVRAHPLSPAPPGPGPMGRARLLGGSRGGGWGRRQRPPLALAHWLRSQGARRPECSAIGCRDSRRRLLLAGAAPVTPGGDWLPGLRGSCLSGSR